MAAIRTDPHRDRLSTFSRAIQLNISIGSNIKPAERAELLAQQKRMDDEVRLMSPANTVCAVRPLFYARSCGVDHLTSPAGL